MATVSKDDLIWLCNQFKSLLEQRVPFDAHVAEGKFLQTDAAGIAYWGDAPIFSDENNIISDIYSSIQSITNLIAPQYVEKPYEKGQYVIHDSNLYKANTKITVAETWNGSHWDNVVISEETYEVDRAIAIIDQIREYVENGEWVTKVNGQSGEITINGSNIPISNSNDKTVAAYIDESLANATTIATRQQIQSLFS